MSESVTGFDGTPIYDLLKIVENWSDTY